MKVVSFSDTHGFHEKLKLPEGDILVCAGDVSKQGGAYECVQFIKWFSALDYRHKIFIAGNHDFFFESNKLTVKSEMSQYENTHYLNDSEIVIDGIKFYGSPVTPWFHSWAFNVHRGEDIRKVWDKIPVDTDVLITHGPPAGILDRNMDGESCGCQDLYDAIEHVNPAYHVFGHIHEGYGLRMSKNPQTKTTFINASVLDQYYRLRNSPVAFEV